MPSSSLPHLPNLPNDPFAHLQSPEHINTFVKQLTKGLRYQPTARNLHTRGGQPPVNHHDPTVLRNALHSLRTDDDVKRYVDRILADYQIDPTSPVDTRALATVQTRSGESRSRGLTLRRSTQEVGRQGMVAGGRRRGSRNRMGNKRWKRRGWYTFRIM